MEEQISRFVTMILDTSADEARTDFQLRLLKFAKVLMNALTALTFAMLSCTLVIATMRLITEALNIDPTGFGALVWLIGVGAGFAGGIRAMRLTQAVRRYQVFALIGIVNVADSLLRNFGSVLRTAVDGSPVEILEAVGALLINFFVSGS